MSKSDFSKPEMFVMIFAVPITIVLTIAYPHAVKYINRTPLERCVSSANVAYLGVGTSEDYCRATLGMEPIEKPVRNQKKKVTLSPENEAKLDAESGSQNPDISTAKGLLMACDTTTSSPDSYANFGDFMADWTPKNA